MILASKLESPIHSEKPFLTLAQATLGKIVQNCRSQPVNNFLIE